MIRDSNEKVVVALSNIVLLVYRRTVRDMSTQMVAGYKGNVIRRRPSLQQGRALEVLGHAIEYLMDSYMLPTSPHEAIADTDAVQLLKGLSLEIFRDCPPLVPFANRVRDVLLKWGAVIKARLSNGR
jgi:hypothetical protein